MSENVKFSIAKFDGKDFAIWKKQITILLKSKGLEILLEFNPENEEDTKLDYQVQTILLNALSPDIAQKIINCKTASETWTRLLSVYENASQSSVDRLFEEFYSYRMDSGTDIATHISKVESLAIMLEQLKHPQSDNAIMTKILMSLPESFLGFRRASDSVHPDFKTKDELVARLMREECDLKNRTGGETAYTSTSRSQNIAELKKRTKCNKCGIIGHWARECRSKVRRQPTQQDEDNVALISTTSNAPDTDSWVIDSGATKHTCNRHEWFKNYESINESIEVADRQCIKAIGQGTVVLNTSVNGRKVKMYLNNVLHAPGISRNLFSIGAAAKRGAIFDFNEQKCVIKVESVVKAIAKYDPLSRLYILDAKVIIPVSMIAITNRDIGQWHEALGHTDSNVIERMARERIVNGLEIVKNSQKCEACGSGKATRASHPTMDNKIDEIGTIDMDLIGKLSVTGLRNEQYAVLMKDRFSHFTG
uniref:Retrovirus-related Pol polyprotein from transposon TNT 1-94 n=1 Tax=Aceria tosichella TaxID=561515 RepID=A0A6G1SJN1_9ACAR